MTLSQTQSRYWRTTMKKADPRVKRAIKRDKRTPEYAVTAYEEMVRLKQYYEDEVIQCEVVLKDDKLNAIEQARIKGMVIAYQDHIDELAFIIELIRGLHLEENDKRVKTR